MPAFLKHLSVYVSTAHMRGEIHAAFRGMRAKREIEALVSGTPPSRRQGLKLHLWRQRSSEIQNLPARCRR
jgi:hypothetical protein